LTVLIGSSLLPIQQDMSRIDGNALLICLGLVLVAPLCGYWLAGRATHPFADMIHATALLRPAKLSERLPVRGTNDELDQLAQQVNKLLDRIALYLETKRDFLANAAHELRTPLAAIRSTVEVALNEDRTPEEYQSVLEGLLDETANLANLVSQLLLLAETEADCLTVAAEFVDLNELVSQSIEMFAPVAEDRGIQLRATQCDSLIVEGSRLHLRQVIINLVENAIKFTPEGGLIAISTTRQEDHSRAVLRVTDTGSGISAEDLPHIFERFFRSDRSRPRQGETRGTGLGLSICESVVQMHGGTITATSQAGKGTEMTVMLPLATTDVPERSILYGKALRKPLPHAASAE
jgi:heavy metal sensor kinase